MKDTICIDLDGVITDFLNCKEGCNYKEYPRDSKNLKRELCPLNPTAPEAIRALKNLGLKIVIWTSRVEEERTETMKWLNKHEIPFDDLIMDKPRAFIYVDDLAFRFSSWTNVVANVYRMRVTRRDRDATKESR
jgi:hypothetical protein